METNGRYIVGGRSIKVLQRGDIHLTGTENEVV